MKNRQVLSKTLEKLQKMHHSIVKIMKEFSGAMILGPRDGTDAAEYFGKN